MIALVVEGLGSEREPTSAAAPPHSTTEGPAPGINPEWHCVRVADDGPQGQLVQELRFPVSFQEASGPSRRVPVSRFQFWMGKLRELVTTTQLPQLIEQIATGRWGLVTNWADVRLLGECTANDVVHMRFWTMPASASAVEFCCEFWKLLPDGNYERMAFAQQKATWVRLVGHGRVQPEPLPAYLAAYVERMGPRPRLATPLPTWPEPLSALHRSDAKPLRQLGDRRQTVLLWDTIQTTRAEANLVGNVYFAHYFTWQERVRDLFLYRSAPDLCRDKGTGGEFLSLQSRMDYLREAMPFDEIEVALSARLVEEDRTLLDFAYYKRLRDGGRDKLAVGQQDVIWIERDERGTPHPAPFPAVVQKALIAGDWEAPPTKSHPRGIPVAVTGE